MVDAGMSTEKLLVLNCQLAMPYSEESYKIIVIIIIADIIIVRSDFDRFSKVNDVQTVRFYIQRGDISKI